VFILLATLICSETNFADCGAYTKCKFECAQTQQNSTFAFNTTFTTVWKMSTPINSSGADSMGHGGTCPHFYKWLGWARGGDRE